MRRTLLVLAAALAVGLLPTTALGAHMTNYRYQPLEHDDQGRSDEPDFLSSSVLGPSIAQCNVALRTAQGFDGRCTPDARPLPGQMATLAPGCTGDAPGGGMERKLSGQCGLWTVGLRTSAIGAGVPPGTVPEPAGEQGLQGGRAPGAFTPTTQDTIRFLDLKVTAWFTPSHQLPQQQVEVNRKLMDLGDRLGAALPGAHSILPGDSILFWWYGEWTDRNGNGVIDHVTPGSAGPTANEFAWLGSCRGFGGLRDPATIAKGLCIEDGNPHLVPPGAPCADPASTALCAGTTVHGWVWPGNHHAYGSALLATPGDYPGQQVVNWALFECFDYATCDDADEQAHGDPLLGRQDSLVPDTFGYDTTGDGSDTVRRWYNGFGWPTTFYGDDGLLVTSIQVLGTNCVPRPGLAAADPARCTFTDVDRQDSLAPAVQELLVGGDLAEPGGGLKGAARGAWVVVRDAEL